MITLTLPVPPTINHYYGQRLRGGRYIKPAGIAFRAAVAEIVAAAQVEPLLGRVSLFAAIYPANRRRQDIDNRAKSLQDALAAAGVWIDDEQIDELHLVRREVVRGGLVRIVITEMKEASLREAQSSLAPDRVYPTEIVLQK